jgi:uncharacterized membrane protein
MWPRHRLRRLSRFAGQMSALAALMWGVNTLPLAYFAASLPLVVAALIAPGGLASRLSTETVAVEVVRALAGTAGVLLAMPLATASALLIGVGEE